MDADGSVMPTAGTLTVFSPPSGPGVRVDTFGRPGLTPSPRYDSLLAKVITRVRGSSFSAAVRKAQTALGRIRYRGNPHQHRIPAGNTVAQPHSLRSGHHELRRREPFRLRRSPRSLGAASPALAPLELYPGEEVLRAQLAGTVIEVAAEGAEFAAGAQLAVLEAMKMQHVLTAPDAVRTVRTLVTAGQVVGTGDPVVVFTRTGDSAGSRRRRRTRPGPGSCRPRRGPAPAPAHPRRGSARLRLPSGTTRIDAPPGRTSPTWWTREASWNTARWRWPRSAAGARRKT